MIRIIRQGTKQIAHCDSCGCEFSFENEDIQIATTTYIGNMNGTKQFILCPQCHREKVLGQTR